MDSEIIEMFQKQMQQFGEKYGDNYKELHQGKSLVMPENGGGLKKQQQNGKGEYEEGRLMDLCMVMQKYSPSFW